MARPKGIPRELLDPEEGEDAGSAPDIPNPMEGYHYRPGRRGPATTLKPDMIPVLARELARTGVQRIAAAKAGTTEDCLGAWLKRGHEAVRRGKRSIYTELLAACEEAWAHRFGFLIELGVYWGHGRLWERALRRASPRWQGWITLAREEAGLALLCSTSCVFLIAVPCYLLALLGVDSVAVGLLWAFALGFALFGLGRGGLRFAYGAVRRGLRRG